MKGIEMKKIFILLGLVLISFSIYAYCTFVFILHDNNFEEGNWLLENSYYDTTLVIDDEKILRNYENHLIVSSTEDDGYTTCDGILRLYKNGELVKEKQYLSKTFLFELGSFNKKYKKAISYYLDPKNKIDLKKKIDSLNKISNYYVTVYRKQPEDIDAIEYFKISK